MEVRYICRSFGAPSDPTHVNPFPLFCALSLSLLFPQYSLPVSLLRTHFLALGLEDSVGRNERKRGHAGLFIFHPDPAGETNKSTTNNQVKKQTRIETIAWHILLELRWCRLYNLCSCVLR